MTDQPVPRRYQQLCLAAFALADPGCKKPKARLKRIRTMLEDNHIDLLDLASACLDEVERNGVPEPRRPMWRKATRRAAKAQKKRRTK